MTAIVWFRRDLRCDDHPALARAAEDHDVVVPVFVHDPDGEGDWAPGAASRAWLHRSLEALDASLRERDSGLLIRSGDRVDVIRSLAEELGADAVYANRAVEPAARESDERLAGLLEDDGRAFRRFVGNELTDLQSPCTQSGGAYRVYTPYWKSLREMLESPQPVSAPASLSPLPDGLDHGAVDDLSLMPERDWAGKMLEDWTPGAFGAEARLADFIDEIGDYDELRDRADLDATSRLSPHLAFGEISPRRVLAMLDDAGVRREATPWVRQLAWREFSRYQLFHEPSSADQAWNEKWRDFPWAEDDEKRLEAWRRGRTGVPIVDAGMRQLWAEGWMHNRVRMIVASYLTKHLGQHWLHGARWFWDTLVDADLANNTMGWQWTAGTGADASPYFRVFNPVSQAERHDPDGEYIARWVPELQGCDDIHQPRDEEDGRNYPAAIVGISEGREAALARYRAFKDRQGDT